MKTHCRCRNCRARKKLNKHPLEYHVQPRCQCGARDWQMDAYRHRVELEQMRNKRGRYQPCHADCFHFPHRMGSAGCKFDVAAEYR